MQIGILEPNHFSKKAVKILNNIGNVSFFNNNEKIDDYISNKNVIFTRLNYFIGKNILKKAKTLQFVCSPTTGLNHIDIEYIMSKNVKIISLKGEDKFLNNIRATSEHAFGLIISLLRNYKDGFITSAEQFDREKLKGNEIYGNNVGIIGFGRIGRILSEYLEVFGANSFYYDIKPEKKRHGKIKKCDSIEYLIKNCNIILLCASYKKINHGFFNRKYIDLLENKYFVNVSRGELVDEEYLLDRIQEKIFFKGVALDVIENESKSNRLDRIIELTKNSNFILTPHMGGATYESMSKTEQFIANKLITQLQDFHQRK